MFGKVTLIFLGLFAQEIISINALVFATHHGLYSPILIHVLFVIATLFDIVVGYYAGSYLRKKTLHSKVTRYVQKLSDRFSLSTKKYRRWVALLVLGNLSFPYINSCIAGYLGMPFWESSFFIFIGDAIWYVAIWLVVLSVSSVVKNLYWAFFIIIAIVILVMVFVKNLKGTKGSGPMI